MSFLKDIWPTSEGSRTDVMAKSITPEMFTTEYGQSGAGPDRNGRRFTGSDRGPLYHLGRKEHLRSGASVLHRYARCQPEADSGDSAVRVVPRCRWAIPSRPTTSVPPARSRPSSPAGIYPAKQLGVPADRFQQLRGSSRQRSRHDTRHVRQHPSSSNLLCPRHGRGSDRSYLLPGQDAGTVMSDL